MYCEAAADDGVAVAEFAGNVAEGVAASSDSGGEGEVCCSCCCSCCCCCCCCGADVDWFRISSALILLVDCLRPGDSEMIDFRVFAPGDPPPPPLPLARSLCVNLPEPLVLEELGEAEGGDEGESVSDASMELSLGMALLSLLLLLLMVIPVLLLETTWEEVDKDEAEEELELRGGSDNDFLASLLLGSGLFAAGSEDDIGDGCAGEVVAEACCCGDVSMCLNMDKSRFVSAGCESGCAFCCCRCCCVSELSLLSDDDGGTATAAVEEGTKEVPQELPHTNTCLDSANENAQKIAQNNLVQATKKIIIL